jgi:protein O-GlcNAc transferase
MNEMNRRSVGQPYILNAATGYPSATHAHIPHAHNNVNVNVPLITTAPLPHYINGLSTLHHMNVANLPHPTPLIVHTTHNPHLTSMIPFSTNGAGLQQSTVSLHPKLKDSVRALEYYRVLAVNPTDWCAHNNLGILYKESDLIDKAIEHYKLALQYGPPQCVARENLAVALTDFGTRLKLNGNTDKAVQYYNEALEYHPAYWPAYFNLGVVYSERGAFDSALKYYQQAIERNPNYVEALCNIGVIYKNSGQLQLAIEYYERALRSNPNFTIAANNLAIALTDLGTQVKNEGRLADGISLYKRALHQHSKYPAAWYNLGVAYAEQCRSDDAKVCYEMAILFDNNCAEAFNNLGVIYKDRGNLDQAIYYYNEALRANPRFSQTLNNLGVIYTMLGKLDEAYEYCTKAIQANPLYAEAHNNLGVLYRDEGRIEEAIQAYADCLAIDPNSRNAGQNRLLAMNSLCLPDSSDEHVSDIVWRAHRDWGLQFARLYERERKRSWPSVRDPNKVLRIGYISADFFTHSVSYFIEAPLAFADPSKTHVTCYSNVARKDKKTAVLQNLAHAWRPIHDKNAREVAELIQKDQIDILVELTGHTAGNRLDVMALKPAPVQVTWIGYPNTTGLPSIDYRITDDIVDPVDTKQKYSEQLTRLPGPFLCYTPPTDAPEVADTPALRKGFVTFGSFNNLAKVNDRVLACWCTILNQVPNSRMLIKCKPFASPTVSAKMLRRFAEHGIDSDRVELISLLPTTNEHLETYAQIDISVDTFPYAGTTTTCEALYMGVPVVTYQRKTVPNHAHNVGATLLSRIEGLSSLIGTSEHQYIEIAVALAKDLPRLQAIRKSLRPNMLASTLCDGKTFVKNLEQLYRKLWITYCEKESTATTQSS